MQVAMEWATEQRSLKGAVGLGHRGRGAAVQGDKGATVPGAGMGWGLPVGDVWWGAGGFSQWPQSRNQ